jgi:hypothetical protein
MLTKLKYKFRGYVKRQKDEAMYKGFIAGMQYGKYLAEKEAKTK